jgi:uncharacterized protein (DUF3084 family)
MRPRQRRLATLVSARRFRNRVTGIGIWTAVTVPLSKATDLARFVVLMHELSAPGRIGDITRRG